MWVVCVGVVVAGFVVGVARRVVLARGWVV